MLNLNKQVEGPTKTVQEGSTRTSKGALSIHTIHTAGLLLFTPAIMEKPMPEQWTPPTFKRFDGSTDPNKHFRMDFRLVTI